MRRLAWPTPISYPAFFINGAFGFEAKDFSRLFAQKSINAQIGPAFQWNILNYGRILNSVRLQDFKTQELVAAYQQKVLAAAQEVESGIVTYWRALEEAAHLAASVKAAERTVSLANALYKSGVIDYTPVFVAEQFLAQQQNLLAQARGDAALGLITVYRALGGGWELRLAEEAAHAEATPATACPPVVGVPPPVNLKPASTSN